MFSWAACRRPAAVLLIGLAVTGRRAEASCIAAVYPDLVTSAVAIQVFGDALEPIPDATVTLRSSRPEREVASGTTDSHGHLAVAKVPPGWYSVVVVLPMKVQSFI